VVGIAEQGEIEILVFLEGGLGLYGIGAHSKDGDAELVEVFFASRNSDASIVQTGRVGSGEEKEGTRCPAKSLSETSLSSSDLRRNAGALARF